MNKAEAIYALEQAGYRVADRAFGLVGGLEFEPLDGEIEIITKGYFWLVEHADEQCWSVEIPGQVVHVTDHPNLEEAVRDLIGRANASQEEGGDAEDRC